MQVTGIFLLLISAAYAQEGDRILGKWFTDKKEAVVEVYLCDGKYCGKIIWLKEPKEKDGSEKLDGNNPDPSKRSRKIIGLDIVGDFQYKGDNEWGDGYIYDPNNGKTYKCKMRLENDQLNVRGYIGISLLGRTTVWTRN